MSTELPKTIYYQSLTEDEFSTMKIKTPNIDGNYRYLREGIFGKLLSFLSLNVVAKPLAFLYLRLKFGHRIIGREKLKPFRRQSVFLYGNHTQIIGDALIPAFIVRPRYFKVIVHQNNTAIPFIGRFVPYLGGLPLPGDFKATRNFLKSIEASVRKNKPIFIYPEAHLWPYYTRIRPFSDASFRYPYRYRTPVFCFTNTYHATKNPNKVRIITYVDGPFFADMSLDEPSAKKKLRDQIYHQMEERAKTSDKEMIHYVFKGESI